MSPVWLVPCTLAVVAAVVLVASSRALRSELTALSEQLRDLSQLREQAHAVREASERTGMTATRTHDALDALAPPAPQ